MWFLAGVSSLVRRQLSPLTELGRAYVACVFPGSLGPGGCLLETHASAPRCSCLCPWGLDQITSSAAGDAMDSGVEAQLAPGFDSMTFLATLKNLSIGLLDSNWSDPSVLTYLGHVLMSFASLLASDLTTETLLLGVLRPEGLAEEMKRPSLRRMPRSSSSGGVGGAMGRGALRSGICVVKFVEDVGVGW